MTSCIFCKSQQSCIANLHMESLAQWRGSTIWKPVMMPLCYLSTVKCIQNYRMAAVSLQTQLHPQPRVSGDNPWAADNEDANHFHIH